MSDAMEIKVGRLYETEDGTFGLCVNAQDDLRLLAFVVPVGERGPALMRTYRSDGTGDGLPPVTKQLWALH